MPSIDRMLVVEASTERNPTVAGGKRGDPVEFIASLKCTPLDPVDAEIRARIGLGGPTEFLQTFVDGVHDVKQGDRLVVGTKKYPVKAVAEWPWRDSIYRQLILEDLKG